MTDILNAEIIKNKIDNRFQVEVFEELDSTNTYLKKLAENSDINNLVVIAEHQTAGRGRLGRTFLSPDGEGLYMSILCRPELSFGDTALLTVATATAVSSAIEDLTGCDTHIKWVNDILINNKKVCGILAEAGMNHINGKLSYAVIGIGINVNTLKLPNEIKDIATSTEIESGIKISRNELAYKIINNFCKYFQELTDRKYLDEYRKKSIALGKKVTVIESTKKYEATVIDLDNNGCLIVEKDGNTITLNSGEISIKL